MLEIFGPLLRAAQGVSLDDPANAVAELNGAGPRHRHPLGEVNYCIALEDTPKFQDQGPGWVVESPGSEHVPTVTEGMMLIVYLLPEGSMEFI